MAAARKTSRKLSSDMHRKLSAISNCSEISNISYKLGMDPGDFKSTIDNILELDVGEAWNLDSDDECGMSCYGDEGEAEREIATVHVEKRKTSTGSNCSADSIDAACDDFEPVKVDLSAVKGAIAMYEKHKKISVSRVKPPVMNEIKE